MSKKLPAVLLRLDAGLLARLDHETHQLAKVAAAEVRALKNRKALPPGKKARRFPRTQVLRALLVEALDRRARARGEQVPTAEPFGHFPEEDESDDAGSSLSDAEVVRLGDIGATLAAQVREETAAAISEAVAEGGEIGRLASALAGAADATRALTAARRGWEIAIVGRALVADEENEQARRNITGLGLEASRIGKVHLKTLGVKPKNK